MALFELTPTAAGARVVAPGACKAALDRQETALMEHAGWKNLRTPRFRYLVHQGGRECLWDLAHDSGEYMNVAAEPGYAPDLAEQRRLLLMRLLKIERPLPRIWPY